MCSVSRSLILSLAVLALPGLGCSRVVASAGGGDETSTGDTGTENSDTGSVDWDLGTGDGGLGEGEVCGPEPDLGTCGEGLRCSWVRYVNGNFTTQRCTVHGSGSRGEACTINDEDVDAWGVSGDTCDLDTQCFHSWADYDQTSCLAPCDAGCFEGEVCAPTIFGSFYDGTPEMCVSSCDPLAEEPYSFWSGTLACHRSEGQQGFECGRANAQLLEPCDVDSESALTRCGSGLICLASEDIGPSCMAEACCTELCDLDVGTCGDDALSCGAVFPELAGNEHVGHIGVCRL